jgi:hypothetical protein
MLVWRVEVYGVNLRVKWLENETVKKLVDQK